jgi:hypothetical protein
MQNIKHYKTNKLIYTLQKPKSKNLVSFYYDKEDNWFIDIVEYSNKTGDIKNTSTIVQSTLEQTVNFYKGHGYEQI